MGKGSVRFRERLRQYRKQRRAFSSYARNGWQSPWRVRNRLLDAIFRL